VRGDRRPLSAGCDEALRKTVEEQEQVVAAMKMGVDGPYPFAESRWGSFLISATLAPRELDAATRTNHLRELDTAVSKITAQGARYPEKLERMTGR
jgi:hypothetical protein